MNIQFCFASPNGDVLIDPETLSRPFVAEPLQYHPFMTLGDFFQGVRDFILSNEGQSLTALLSQSWGREVTINDVDTIVIRYEKYGTLYQIVSADIISGDNMLRCAVSAALTLSARENIEFEYNLISTLNQETGLPYLPRVYFIHPVRIERNGRIENMIMTMAEWFEGYHEWHYYKDTEGKHRIAIWDMGGGNRFVSEQEAREIVREAAKILTLYYDVSACKRIIPWHHGAGDFVASIESGKVDVKLVTVRGYESFSSPDAGDPVDPNKGLLLFLLEVTTKMRMDKREGVGYTTWADSTFAEAAAEGFFQAMRIREAQGGSGSVRVDDFMASIKTLSQDDIESAIRSRLDEYRSHDTSDHQVLAEHLRENARDLTNIFQRLS